MRIGTGFGLLALALNPALLAAQPEAQQILQQIAETYKSVSEYELVANATVTGTGQKMRMHFAFKAPNLYHLEGLFPGISPDFGAVLAVHDGSDLWLYFPETNQYASMPASELTADAPGDLGDMSPEAMSTFMTWRYRSAAEFMESALLREEAIDLDCKKVECHVLTVSQKKGGIVYTWWVDKQRHYILREDNAAPGWLGGAARGDAANRARVQAP